MSNKKKILIFVAGYIRESINELQFDIPLEITSLISLFYPRKFIFDNEVSKQCSTTNNGLTINTKRTRSGKNVILFGKYLYHKYGDRFKCTFIMNKGSSSGFEIGLFTTGFDAVCFSKIEDSTSGKLAKYAVLNAGNGWFRIDETKFKCKQCENFTHGPNEYFYNEGTTVQMDINMETKIAKFGIFELSIPDVVHILIVNDGVNTVTVSKQEWY